MINYNYEYINMPVIGMQNTLATMQHYIGMQCEYGNKAKVEEFLADLRNAIEEAKERLINMEPEPELRACEPDEYEKIVALSKGGNKAATEIKDLSKRMAGAVIGRFAGCILGVPVENWEMHRLKDFAEKHGMEFPPVDYWTEVENPQIIHYGKDTRDHYKKGVMNCVAVDDDITYTLIGLIILEKYGFDFTTADVGATWQAQLNAACTAERAALDNLNAGIPAEHAAEKNNPYVQWIGADIRADPFAYAAAGDPHYAAELGYRDAYLSHRRNGIYGEMFFAAAEAAAFTVDDPMEALKIAMNEIPENCRLHKDLEWAFETCPKLKSYEDAVDEVNKRFFGMDRVHTNNNACLTVFGIYLGKGDFTKSIGITVAMGYDNDCTAATVGSIVGATVGIDKIDKHWYECFNNDVHTYMKDYPEFKIDDVIARFEKLVNSRLGK